MKPVRFALPLVLLAFSSLALAQSPADRSFDQLKSLAGTWRGTVTSFPVIPAVQGSHVQVRARVTSSGHAILHEIKTVGRPDDPITMLYLNGNRLFLRQYADFGNRPRLVAKASPDGKKIEFNVVDVSGTKRYGYMEHAVFTVINANHHTEDWTFLAPGNHPMRLHMDLHRDQ
ncbi:MAG: hypothetical protein ACRD4X_08310 [Candidatus Acidiferrales bacterium]